MAELVQQVIESSIQNLSPLEKYGLFESSEIKLILKKRKEFEYRLRKVNKCKDDFLRYISYEESLLKLIRIRREKCGLEVDKNEVEQCFIDHIKKLFEFTLNKFQFDIPLWLSYIDFAKTQRMLDHVSIIYFRMLQIHNKDWLWLKFAKFEFEEKSSSESARKVFLKCLNFHSDSKQVWYEYFRFELLYCSKIRKRFRIITEKSEKSEIEDIQNKQSNDAIWNGQLACIVYKHAIDVFSSFEFASEFLSICNKFDYEISITVKETIISDLKLRFGTTEEFWDLLARNKVEEYKQKLKDKSIVKNEEKLQIKIVAIKEAISIYEKACLNFNNVKIWNFYLLFRLEDLQVTLDSNSAIDKIAEIIFSFEKLLKEDKLSSDLFKEWVKLVYTFHKTDYLEMQKLQDLLLEADKLHSDLEMSLFIACLLVKLPAKNNERILQKFFEDSLFKRFNTVVADNMEFLIDFWELYIDWSVEKKISYHKIMKIINELSTILLHSPREMGEYFKSKILSVMYDIFGIQKARSYYENNKSTFPICKSFCYKMIDIEKLYSEMQEDPSKILSNNIISIYEDLIHHFGNNNAQIWLDYIAFMINTDLTKVSPLYNKALKSLDSSTCNMFVQKYSLLKTSI